MIGYPRHDQDATRAHYERRLEEEQDRYLQQWRTNTLAPLLVRASNRLAEARAALLRLERATVAGRA